MRNNIAQEALLAVVAEWLEEGQIPPLVPREQPRVDPRDLKRILAVVGPRRSGKTFYMYQLMQLLLDTEGCTRRDILFVDFEDYRLAGFSTGDVDGLFAAFHQLAGQYPRFLFFDEVQRLPEWSRVLRTLHNRQRYKIVVSGSNSRLLHHEVATELRGRYEDVLMLPFSFREVLRHKGLWPSAAALRTPARGQVMGAFEEYLRHGGFPEVVLSSSDLERGRLLQNYCRTIFHRDILERHSIRAQHVMDALMSEVLETYSGLFSVSRFEKQLKGSGMPVSKRTISNYLRHLEEAFFLLAHDRFSDSPRKRMMNPKKIYLMDTGFARLGRSFSENKGRALENLVAVELHRRGLEADYFKDRRECDLIVRRGARPDEAIQVCWELTPQNEARECAGLAAARRRLGVANGTILTYAQEGERELNGWKVRIRPAWEWVMSWKPERTESAGDE